MTAILFPKNQIELLTSGKKTATLRSPNFKVNKNLSLKFISNFKYGAFMDVPTFKIKSFNLNNLDDGMALKLGYNSPKEYLKNNDWGVDGNKRLLIEWDYKDALIKWDAVNKNIGGF